MSRFGNALIWLWALASLSGTSAYTSDFGATGLIDLPSRMKADDTAFAAYDERYKQFSLTYQALPWFENLSLSV